MARTSGSPRLRRPTTLVLVTVLGMTGACGSGTDGGSGSSVDAVETATTDDAGRAVPLAATALGARTVEAVGQWQSCMALSWRYEVFAQVTAPRGDSATRLAAVRAALLEGGYDDDTQVDGHVTVVRADTTVDVRFSPVRGPGTWIVTVQSPCADYDGDDLDRVEDDEERPLRGLARP